MIDRLSALADIVPPRAVAPPPPLPWWQGPWGWAAASALACALAWWMWAAWRTAPQRRALRALRRIRAELSSTAAMCEARGDGADAVPGDQRSLLACEVVAHAQAGGVALQAWPTAWRRRFDTLRYAPGVEVEALREGIAVLDAALRRLARHRRVPWRRSPSAPGQAAPRPERAR